MMTRKLTVGVLALILLGVGSLSACATTPSACKQVCEVEESEPCQKCVAQDKERRDEERRKRAEERRNTPPPASYPSGGGGGGGMGY
jgi:hypothetical protein